MKQRWGSLKDLQADTPSDYYYFQSHHIGHEPYDFAIHCYPTDEVFVRVAKCDMDIFLAQDDVWEERKYNETEDVIWERAPEYVIGEYIKRYNLMPIEKERAFLELI
jgi:hypothetical protein